MTGLNGIGTGTSVIGSLNLNTSDVFTSGGLVAQALNTSDVRSDKVAALQTAIASGSYQVSSADVASKIVDSLL